jgi:hypothetical protein
MANCGCLIVDIGEPLRSLLTQSPRDIRSAAWATRIIQHHVLQNNTKFGHQLHLGPLPAAERENAYRTVRDMFGVSMFGVYAPVPGDDADVMCVYAGKGNSVYGYVVYERTPTWHVGLDALLRLS